MPWKHHDAMHIYALQSSRTHLSYCERCDYLTVCVHVWNGIHKCPGHWDSYPWPLVASILWPVRTGHWYTAKFHRMIWSKSEQNEIIAGAFGKDGRDECIIFSVKK